MAEARRFLLDTNIASYVIRGANEALRIRLEATPLHTVAVSSITAGELLYGLARRPLATGLKTAVHAFLRYVEVLPWDDASAVACGPLRASLEGHGLPLGTMDTLIAAHALATGRVLVTNDRALGRTPGLLVEDWSVATG